MIQYNQRTKLGFSDITSSRLKSVVPILECPRNKIVFALARPDVARTWPGLSSLELARSLEQLALSFRPSTLSLPLTPPAPTFPYLKHTCSVFHIKYTWQATERRSMLQRPNMYSLFREIREMRRRSEGKIFIVATFYPSATLFTRFVYPKPDNFPLLFSRPRSHPKW